MIMTEIEKAAIDVVRNAKPPTEKNMKDGLMIPARFGYALEMALVNAGLYDQTGRTEKESKGV